MLTKQEQDLVKFYCNKDNLTPEEQSILDTLIKKSSTQNTDKVEFNYVKPSLPEHQDDLIKFISRLWEENKSTMLNNIDKLGLNPFLKKFIDVSYNMSALNTMNYNLNFLTKIKSQNIFSTDDVLKNYNLYVNTYLEGLLKIVAKTNNNAVFTFLNEAHLYCLWLFIIDDLCKQYKFQPDYYLCQSAGNITYTVLTNNRELIEELLDRNGVVNTIPKIKDKIFH